MTPAITVSPVAEKHIAQRISANLQKLNEDSAGMNVYVMMSGKKGQQRHSSRKSLSDSPTLRRTFLKVMLARSPFCSVMTIRRTVPSA